jgi:gamma-glutamyltranspeptidase
VELDSLGLLLITTPPPTSGPLLGFLHRVMEDAGIDANTEPYSVWNAAEKIRFCRRFLEATKTAYGLRSELGDPDFVRHESGYKNGLAKLSSWGHAKSVNTFVDNDIKTVTDPSFYGFVKHCETEENEGGTSHVCVVGSDRLVISATTSINM